MISRTFPDSHPLQYSTTVNANKNLTIFVFLYLKWKTGRANHL